MCDGDECCWSAILGSIFGVFALVGLLCMTAGYVNNRNKNGVMVLATCAVVSTQTLPDSCYNYCCYTDSDNNCVSCYQPCFSGYVDASIPNITDGSTFKVFSDRAAINVNAYLSVNYKVGKLFSCFYTFSGSSVSIQLGLSDIQGPYIAGLVFLSLAAFVLIIWFIILCPSILDCFGACCGDCCGSCCSDIGKMCIDPCRSCRRSMQQTKSQKQKEKLEAAQRDLEKANELRAIEEQVARSPHPAQQEQFARNPDYVVDDAYANVPENMRMEAPNNGAPSAPPLGDSQKNPL
jgi:hypothetical protein